MEQLYTREQLIEKYRLQTKAKNPSSDEFIKYCKYRGLDIKKTAKRINNKIAYQIINDNQKLENEEWRFVESAQLYVSNLGRVKTLSDKILTLFNRDGYLSAKSNIIDKEFRVHRLVLMAFNPIENPSSFDVDHINGIRNDNRVENLRWVSVSTNLENRDKNKNEIGELISKIVQKFGYSEALSRISAILNDENN